MLLLKIASIRLQYPVMRPDNRYRISGIQISGGFTIRHTPNELTTRSIQFIKNLIKFQHCGQVLGLEVVADAIKDAKANVVKNGVTNCEFFVGKAEDILIPVIHRTTKTNITAIVDPPRAGLRKLKC